jgi:hypothetical protein
MLPLAIKLILPGLSGAGSADQAIKSDSTHIIAPILRLRKERHFR